MSAALEDLYNLLTWFPDHSINQAMFVRDAP